MFKEDSLLLEKIIIKNSEYISWKKKLCSLLSSVIESCVAINWKTFAVILGELNFSIE